MKTFIVRIHGLRLTVTAPNVFDAINQVRAAYPLHLGGSAKVAL